MVAKWPLEVEIAMGTVPVPISVSSGHFALRYEVPKFLARGGHLCMATVDALLSLDQSAAAAPGQPQSAVGCCQLPAASSLPICLDPAILS